MELNLKGKSFLKLLDLSPEEINGLLELSMKLKKEKKEGAGQWGSHTKKRKRIERRGRRLQWRVPSIIFSSSFSFFSPFYSYFHHDFSPLIPYGR